MLDPTSFTLPTRRDVNMLLQCTNLCRQLYRLNNSGLSLLLQLTKQLMLRSWVSFKLNGSCVAWMSPWCRWERTGTWLKWQQSQSVMCSTLFEDCCMNVYLLQAYLLWLVYNNSGGAVSRCASSPAVPITISSNWHTDDVCVNATGKKVPQRRFGMR